ncbi:LPD16 domain-containing protein [Anaerotignum sp.]|nr:LPD16 domain-containing protein [Anaerotignum sp.]MBQ7757913.1 hypothetical protein [Anaerotignum sp.]
MRQITEELIQEAIRYGVKRTDAEHGYYIACCSDYGNGATHIERIDVMDIFLNDWHAALQAERDGIKIIRDLVFPVEHDAPYIDNPTNRLLLQPLVLREVVPSQRRMESQFPEEQDALISQPMADKPFLPQLDDMVETTLTYAEVNEMLKADICGDIETLIEGSPNSEQIGLMIKDGDIRYLSIQTCEDGYDYTFYDEEFNSQDGGQLDMPELSMAQAIFELLKDIDAQYAPLGLYDYNLLREKEEISQKHWSIANQAMFHAKEVLLNEGLLQDVTITGTRLYDSPFDPPEDLDYDVLLQYEGNIREDDFFNLLNQHKCIIDHRPIDFTPIRPDKSGTIIEYLRKLDKRQAL